MKIQINGFDIELNTEDTKLILKVLDSNGKELSNNIYSQSSDANNEVIPVQMPSAEETNQETNPQENTEEIEPENKSDIEEGFIPSFSQFKKLKN